ncbi:unnamed protein product [Mycena citricolor]|uniref:Uncharacterized protein n=1 Tax=Mycena citricolor TaxID=2018698 RepID=A0AAD2JU34_9AGAR|nr:unnamed protein product [Mycena citricolor]
MAILTAVLALCAPLMANALTWSFTNAPTQCANLSVSVNGGTPPYRILIIPFGTTPLSGGTEVRKILDEAFPGNSPNTSFQLNYPANSQFVAVVSDSTGFGSGGTSVNLQVANSSDSSCFNPNQKSQPTWVFSINPLNSITSCQPTRLWWDPSSNAPQGTPRFEGVIPGGISFDIPVTTETTVPQQGLGFNWTVSLAPMTTVILVGGDDRGFGTAGSSLYIVGNNIQSDSSCLNSSSPSSTPGAPAGGVATSTSSSTSTSTSTGSSSPNSSQKSNGSNVGAIVGGTIGGLTGLVALCLVGLFLYRRRRYHDEEKRRPRPDLLNADEGDDGEQSGNELPQFYRPEPFVVPDPTRASLGGLTEDERRTSGYLTEEGRPLSGYYAESHAGTHDPSISMSTATRKTGMRQMRPVNIIQHSDAGPSQPLVGGEDDEPETVELPPAYTNIPSGSTAPPPVES